jgi:hypothetical protein
MLSTAAEAGLVAATTSPFSSAHTNTIQKIEVMTTSFNIEFYEATT